MYKGLLCFLLLVTLSSTANSQTEEGNIYAGNVKFDSVVIPGTVTLSSTGFAKKKAESIKDAFSQAFYILLFRGLAGSPYEFPLIQDEGQTKGNTVVKELLAGGYSSFVTESNMQSEDTKTKGKDGVKGIMVMYRITINYDAFRRYLEQNKLIRKFGI